MVIDLAVQLQGKVKDNTPVKTGHLRNEWHIGSIEKRGNEYYIEIIAKVITGLILSSGSTGVHELVAKLRESRVDS